MATQFSPSVGYRGVVKIANKASDPRATAPPANFKDIILLATGGSFQMQHQPIMSTGIHGAGYWNAAENVAYSDDIIRLDGSMSCELTAGEVFQAIKAFAFDNRGSKHGTRVTILPDGINGFVGWGWCTQLSFSAQANSNITCEIGFGSYLDGANNKVTANGDSVGIYNGDDPTNLYKYGASNYDQNGNPINAAKATPTPTANGLRDFVDYNGLFPYWASCVYSPKPFQLPGYTRDAGHALVPDIIGWNASYSSSLEQMKCCGMDYGAGGSYASHAKAPLAPDYVAIGTMQGQCDVTVFKLQGDFNPELFHDQKGYCFRLASPAEQGMQINGGAFDFTDTEAGHFVNIPIVVCSGTSGQVTTGSSWIQAGFQYQAIGDGSQPPVNLTDAIYDWSAVGSAAPAPTPSGP